jgi:hypothetical protein
MTDNPLHDMNVTELIQVAREAGFGNVSRALPREEIIALIEDGEETDAEKDALEDYRHEMEAHIKRNFRRIRTQLPGCNGKCMSYGCPDIIVQRCWGSYRDDIL